MNFKKYKWLFYIFTFFLITVVATVLSAMKPGDKIPDFSNAILLVGTVYVILILLYRLFKLFRNKREDKEIKRMAADIFTDDEAPTRSRGNFFNKVQLKKINTKFFLITIGLVSVVFFFYWYQWKPSEIRKSCAEEAKGGRRITNSNISGINNRYRECLVKHGFKPESLFVK